MTGFPVAPWSRKNAQAPQGGSVDISCSSPGESPRGLAAERLVSECRGSWVRFRAAAGRAGVGPGWQDIILFRDPRRERLLQRPSHGKRASCGSDGDVCLGADALHHTLLYYIIPHHTILYYTILYYTILYYTILYYKILHYTILYYTILYHSADLMSNDHSVGTESSSPSLVLWDR